MSERTHWWQRGLFAMQTRRPWRMRRRLRPVHSLAGTMLHTSSSIFTGSVAEVSLSNRVSRVTCVSTANPGTPNATPSTTFAVLRPTPRSVHQILHPRRHLTAVAQHEVLAHLANRASLGAKEPRLVDDRFDIALVSRCKVRNRRIARKQRGRHRIDIHIRCLRAENHRNQQLPRTRRSPTPYAHRRTQAPVARQRSARVREPRPATAAYAPSGFAFGCGLRLGSNLAHRTHRSLTVTSPITSCNRSNPSPANAHNGA